MKEPYREGLAPHPGPQSCAGSREVPVTVRVLSGDEIGPGDSGWVQLRTTEPVPMLRGDRFILRDTQDTMAGGVVLVPDAARHRRNDESVASELEALASGSGESAALQTLRSIEPATIAELGRYVTRIESEGYDATRYRVDFHAKLAFPFTSVIMAILGIGVALYQGKRGGIAIGVAVSIALAFIYILIFQLVLSLGYAGNLHPLLAAWAANLFFGITGLFLLAHAMH